MPAPLLMVGASFAGLGLAGALKGGPPKAPGRAHFIPIHEQEHGFVTLCGLTQVRSRARISTLGRVAGDPGGEAGPAPN